MSVLISLATIPGREASLRKTLTSLEGQGSILVALNGHSEDAAHRLLEEYPSVLFAWESENRGDAMKFAPGYPLRNVRVHFTCDDDIIYPPDYVQHTLQLMERSPHFNAVCYHGAILKQPFESYYESRRRTYHCTQEVPAPCRVHVPGTGVFAYRPSAVRFRMRDFPHMNMADTQVAVKLAGEHHNVWCLPRRAGWLQLADPYNEDTIWHASVMRKDGSVMDTADKQTAYVRQHLNRFFPS